jgi:hypothetical protein
MKLKRGVVEARYEANIERWANAKRKVIWEE